MEPLAHRPEFKAFFTDADHAEVKNITATATLREFIAGMLNYAPWWLIWLYRLREILVRPLRLVRHATPDRRPFYYPSDISFEPQGRVSFFTVRKAEENRYWIAETPRDNHLAATVGVVASLADHGMTRFSVFTTVHYRHWSGPVYFNLIRPFHHLVVSRMMKAGAAFKTGAAPMQTRDRSDCRLIDRFSLTEKVLFRAGWYGFMGVGIWGIYRQAPGWAAAYLVFALLAFAFLILPGLCAHCPYPSRYATCLFLPPAVLNRLYPYRGPRMRPADKWLVSLAMAGIVVVPQIWLIGDPLRLALFWLLGLPTLVAFPVHYCKRCRHFDCPLNKAETSSDARFL